MKTKNEMMSKGVFDAMLGIPLIAIVIVTAIACRGLAISTLWSWFVAERFSLPPLTIPHAIGLMCLLGATRWPSDCNRKEREGADAIATFFFNGFFQPGIVLLIGWIVKTML